MSKQLRVYREGAFDYQIAWEEDFSKLGEMVKNLQIAGDKICIVSDDCVASLYGDMVKEALTPAASQIDSFTFPSGEASKNLDTVKDLYAYLIENHYTRKDLLVALGGGVTGDLTGYAAATYLRGIDFIQIPTTLLAQVDSSIGGKTGVDFDQYKNMVGDLTGYAAATYLRGIDFIQIPTTLLAQVDSSIGGKTGVDFDQYKNMVGAFCQPRLVYMNLNTLKSLSEEQFANGMGEVLKTGLIRDGKFYEWTINHMSEIQERIYPVLVKMIKKCCEIKSAVVENDPTEQGERAILNLGHTVGHAIEKLKNFQLLHGQCVALGTIAAAYISFKREYLSLEEFYEIRDMNVGFDLPIFFNGLSTKDILQATKSDKKMVNGTIRFILLKKIGQACDMNVGFDLPIFFNGLSTKDILQATKSDKKMVNGTIRFILLKKIGQACIDTAVTDEELTEAINFINGDLIDGE